MRRWLMGLGIMAGLMGATGVALAAVGAHRAGSPIVTTAAYVLLLHAAALVALIGIARNPLDRWLLLASSMIGLGAAIFSGDLAMRALADLTLFHMAAPAGGILMIVGWLTAALALPLSLRATSELR